MRALHNQRGIVFVEFLIAFTPFFLLFLGTVQLAFLAQAHLVVQHAALRAARTAVITIDDDPFFYEGEPRKLLRSSGEPKGKSSPAEVAVSKVLPSDAAATQVQKSESKGGDRLKRIRTAAYLPLSVISPTRQQVARWIPFATSLNQGLKDRSLAAATGDEPMWRVLVGFGAYSRAASAITFPTAPGRDDLRDTESAAFADADLITARVTFLYPCMVPLVRSLVCMDALDMTGLPGPVRATLSAAKEPSYDSLRRAYHQWRYRFPDNFAKFTKSLRELSKAEWPLILLGIVAHLDEKFVVITKEATLPNHGAPYKYYSEIKAEEEGANGGATSPR